LFLFSFCASHWTHIFVFAADKVHHDSVGVTREDTVSNPLVANGAHFVGGDNSPARLVVNPLFLDLQLLRLQEVLANLIVVELPSVTAQDRFNERVHLLDIDINGKQLQGLAWVNLVVALREKIQGRVHHPLRVSGWVQVHSQELQVHIRRLVLVGAIVLLAVTVIDQRR